jgi:hypothetical protein
MKHLLISAVLTISTASFAGEYINPKETQSQAQTVKNALIELQQDMTTKFAQIESDLASGSHGSALLLAKQTLDSVRAKTGIDPKLKIQESFLVSTTFKAGAKDFSDLDEAQRIRVIRAVSDFRGGLYMDIMNLSKRTTLLYIRALKQQMEKNGGLNNEDKKKIINDLVRTSLVPMKIEDKKRQTIIAFDEDIANEDHIYMFNREVKMFLTGARELNVTEEGFNNLREQLRGLLTGKAVPTGEAPSITVNRCMASTNALTSALDSDYAKVACIKKFAQSMTATYEICRTLTEQLISVANETWGYETCIKGIK